MLIDVNIYQFANTRDNFKYPPWPYSVNKNVTFIKTPPIEQGIQYFKLSISAAACQTVISIWWWPEINVYKLESVFLTNNLTWPISPVYSIQTYALLPWVVNKCSWYPLFNRGDLSQSIADLTKHLQYIPRTMHTVFALLCFVVVIHWLIFPYPSGLLRWHCGNLTIAPVPAKQPWWIWINTSCEFIINDCITTTKQSTVCIFLGIYGSPSIWNKALKCYLLILK